MRFKELVDVKEAVNTWHLSNIPRLLVYPLPPLPLLQELLLFQLLVTLEKLTLFFQDSSMDSQPLPLCCYLNTRIIRTSELALVVHFTLVLKPLTAGQMFIWLGNPLWNSGCPETHSEDQALTLRSQRSICLCLGLKAWVLCTAHMVFNI